MLVLGGRAPAWRWGQGSLQEIDHVPFVRPVTKFAATAESTAEMPGLVDEALAVSLQPHSGPTFVDFPLDLVFSEADEPEAGPALPDPAAGPEPDGDDLDPRDHAAARGRAPGDHGRVEPVLGARRGGAPGARRGARDPGVPQRPGARLRRRPTMRSRSRARARPRSRAPTSRSSSACRWTSASASASRSARRRRSSRSTAPSRSTSTRARSRRSSTAAWRGSWTRCGPARAAARTRARG